MEKMHFHAARIDIGSRKVYVGLENSPVRSFETFTSDLVTLKDYLLENEVSTVAMEATGVYWYVLYDILLDAGLDVWLVDGRQTRQLPGRKTDVKDCQWIQQLHSYGLLNRCYVSAGLVKELRSYQRLREDHLRSAAMHVQHMQKALIEMNIRLPEVLSQVHGASGMALIKAILEGQRDVEKLVSLCHAKIRDSKEGELRKALQGHYTQQGLFALSQAVKAYEFYQEQISDCDHQIDATLQKDQQRQNIAARHRRRQAKNNTSQQT